VKYLLTFEKLPEDKYKLVMSEGETLLYENQQVIKRAFLAQKVIKVATPEKALEKIFELNDKLSSVAVVTGGSQSLENLNLEEKC